MTSSAPHSPARYRDVDTDSNASPSQPSPAKLLRIQQLSADIRASSLPPRRLSPAKMGQFRPRLNQYYTFDHAVSLLRASRNVVVLTGAGISTSLGVPDFRSKNGVYNLLEDSKYDDPQDLFHIDYFKMDPDEFYKQAKRLFPKMQGLVRANSGASQNGSKAAEDVRLIPKFSATHAFISLLQAKGRLLTNYTQNIDGLETAAGISSSKLIQCHGCLTTASCLSCGKQHSAKKYMRVVEQGNTPLCRCSEIADPKPRKRTERGRSGKKKRKRAEYEDLDSDDDQDGPGFRKGLLKPDMTFFGEHISYSYAPRLEMDKKKIDLLVIIGTSLKVEPVSEMLFKIPPGVPQIWISKERCQREGAKVDIELLGECDLIIEELCRRAGWLNALNERKWTPDLVERKKKNLAEPASNTGLRKESSKLPKDPRASSPIKPEQTLEMRLKINDSPGLSVKPNTKLNSTPTSAITPTIKLNNEELPIPGSPEEGTNTPQWPPSTKNRDSNTHPQSKTGCTKISLEEGEKPKAKPPESPKVVIELEEGTRWRWFVKRAK